MTSYDPTTTAGQVRLLIPDTSTTTAVYSDAEITAFLALAGQDVYLAAALGCETIAANEAMVLKVMTVLGTSTNGASVCNSLLARAEKLRSMAGSAALTGDPGFAGGEFVGVASAAVDEFTYREIVGWT